MLKKRDGAWTGLLWLRLGAAVVGCNSIFSALLFTVGWFMCNELCFPIVSVAYQRPLLMDQDGVSRQSTCGVPKGIWNGFILAELSGCWSDSARQEGTSEGVSKWDQTSGEHGYS
jgi:hypothetical protein